MNKTTSLHHVFVLWLNSPFFFYNLSIFILSYWAKPVEFLLNQHSPQIPLGCSKLRGTSAGLGLQQAVIGVVDPKPQLLSAVRWWSLHIAAQRHGLWKGSRILTAQAALGSEAVQPIPLYQRLKGNFCSSRRTLLIKAARGTRGISARACSCIFKTRLCSSYRGKVQRSRTLFNMSKTRSFKIHFQTVSR